MAINTSIHINEVLSLMENPEFNYKGFRLGFVRATGKKQGTIKIIERARKGPSDSYHRPRSRTSGVRGPNTKKQKHKTHMTLPITDLETNTYMTPKISHMIIFNNAKIKH